MHALEAGKLRKLTKVNDELLSQLQLATTEDFTSTSKDGTVVNGLIVKPASYTPGKKYPTLLIIHGGPNGQDDHSFNFDNEFFAANGYVVLNINYRGSSGRGEAFQKAIYADWGNKEVVDLLGAVDQAVASGVADPDRLGIGGWSYGGILTDYTIASDPRFKAAVSGAGSALQSTMYGTRPVHRAVGRGDRPAVEDAGPVTSRSRIRSGTRTGSRRPRSSWAARRTSTCPSPAGSRCTRPCGRLGIDTQLVIYPGQFHGLTVPSYQRDRLERYLAWFDKYLKK